MLKVRIHSAFARISSSSHGFASSSTWSFRPAVQLRWSSSLRKPLLFRSPSSRESLHSLHTTIPALKTNQKPYDRTTNKGNSRDKKEQAYSSDDSFLGRVAFRGIWLVGWPMFKHKNIRLDLQQLEAEMRAVDPGERPLGLRFLQSADTHRLSPAARKTYEGIVDRGWVGYHTIWELGNLKIAAILYLIAITAPLAFLYRIWIGKTEKSSLSTSRNEAVETKIEIPKPNASTDHQPTGYYDDFADSRNEITKSNSEWSL